MKILNILSAFLLFVLPLSFNACKGDVNPGSEQVTESLAAFTLGADRLSLNAADIRVRHDGDPDLKWFYIYTDDLSSDADALIDEAIEEELNFSDKLVAVSGNNKSLRLSGLAPKTYYRIIVKQVNVDGHPLGKAAVYEFRTQRDLDVFEVNDNWTLSYSERSEGFYPGYAELIEFENFECKSSDEEPYIVALIKKSDFANFAKDPEHKLKIRTFFEQYLATSGVQSGSEQWIDIIETGNCVWQEQRIRHGEWLVFMIGVDENGELTGLYKQFEILVPEEEQTDDYKKWLGTWEVTAYNAGVPMSFQLIMLNAEANMWITSIGWEPSNVYGYDPADLPVEIFFDKNTGKAYLVSQHVGTAVDNTGLTLDFYFYGSFAYGDGNTFIASENQRLAELTINEDGTEAVMNGLEFTTMQAGTQLSFQYKEVIYYLVYRGQQQGSAISLSHPDFPFTMTKISE